MQIKFISVMVEDQDSALHFYTTVLGFEKMADIPMGQFRWLTVTSPDGIAGVELVLEPMGISAGPRRTRRLCLKQGSRPLPSSRKTSPPRSSASRPVASSFTVSLRTWGSSRPLSSKTPVEISSISSNRRHEPFQRGDVPWQAESRPFVSNVKRLAARRGAAASRGPF